MVARIETHPQTSQFGIEDSVRREKQLRLGGFLLFGALTATWLVISFNASGVDQLAMSLPGVQPETPEDEEFIDDLWIPPGAQGSEVPFNAKKGQFSVDIERVSDGGDEDGWRPCGEVAYTGGADILAGCEYKLLREAPDGGAEMFIRTPPSFVWPTHWHTNSEHLLGVIGDTPMFFEDGTRHSIKPGQYIYIPNGLIHSAYCTSAGPCQFLLYTDKGSDFNVVDKGKFAK